MTDDLIEDCWPNGAWLAAMAAYEANHPELEENE